MIVGSLLQTALLPQITAAFADRHSGSYRSLLTACFCLFGLALTLVGCTTSYEVQSVRSSNSFKRPDRIWVESDLDVTLNGFSDSGPEFGKAMLDGLTSGIQKCALKTHIGKVSTQLQLNPESTRQQEMRPFNPDAFLFITLKDAGYFGGKNAIDPDIELLLRDSVNHQSLWRTTIGINTALFSTRSELGKNAAKQMLNRLSTDAVITCTPAP